MRKYSLVFIILIFCVILFSCAEADEDTAPAEINIDIDIRDLYNAIKGQIDFEEHDDHGYDEYSADLIKHLFGITEEDAAEIIAIKKIDFNNAFNEEILILARSENNDKAKETAAKLEKYKDGQLKTLTDYTIEGNEAQYYLMEESEITVKQNYVFWVVDGRRKEINNIIEVLFYE